MDVELEFDKKCRVSLSPKTVLPLAPKISSIHIEEQCTTSNDIRFDCHSHKSASCRTIPSRFSLFDGPAVIKRGSVYQNSSEVMKMQRMFDAASRTKIEIYGTYAKLDGSYQDSAMHHELITSSRIKVDEEPCLSDGFIDIDVFGNGLCGDLSHLVEEVHGPTNDGNVLLEEDEVRGEVEIRHKFRTSTRSSSSRFSPLKKLIDPFLKSKSHNSPPILEQIGGCGKSCELMELKEHVSAAEESSALLHACLTLKPKDGTPLFEFKMKSPEANFVARISKRNSNVGDLVYTFHSVSARKRPDSKESLPVLGQMRVSSRLCTESNAIADMATEFVMYDLASRDSSVSRAEANNLNSGLNATLHPSMETAAIVIRIDVPEVVVVTPAGSHSLPDAENEGPSSLLERWRLGGGCGCGGWDMGCPVTVFTSPVNNETTNHGGLIVQGGKNRTSALSIKVTGDGNYDITFHAGLSALQAFSISVAMLHGFKVSFIQRREDSDRIAQCSPLKQLVESMDDSEQNSSSIKQSHMSFAVNPPFSPMSRV